MPEQDAVKVLIVDDDHMSVQLCEARLKSAGFVVISRTESLGTSEAIARQKPDVVLLDVHMPGLNGDRLAEVIRRTVSRRVAVILHSSLDPTALKEKARACNAVGCISKTDNDVLFNTQFQRLVRRALLDSQAATSSQ